MRSRRTCARSYCACCTSQPSSRAAENLRQPHGHFGRNAALPVHQFRKRVARDAKGFGGVRDASSPKARCTGAKQRLRGAVDFSWSWVVLLSVVIDIINVRRCPRQKRKITRQLARTVTAQKPFICWPALVRESKLVPADLAAVQPNCSQNCSHPAASHESGSPSAENSSGRGGVEAQTNESDPCVEAIRRNKRDRYRLSAEWFMSSDWIGTAVSAVNTWGPDRAPLD